MPDYDWTCSACQEPNQAGVSICTNCEAEAAQSALSIFTEKTGRRAWQYFFSPEILPDVLRMLKIASWWLVGAMIFYLSIGYESTSLRVAGTVILLLATWFWFDAVFQMFKRNLKKMVSSNDT